MRARGREMRFKIAEGDGNAARELKSAMAYLLGDTSHAYFAQS